MQSAEAARSGGDLVFSVPLKGCEVIFTFCFLEFDTSSLFLSHHLVFYVPLKGCEVILTFFFLNSFTSTTFTFLIIPIVYCAHLKSFKVIISLSLLIRSNLKLVFYLSCFPYQYFHLYHFHFLHQYITRSSLVFITIHDVIILFCNLIMFVPQSLPASLFCNKCWQMKMERV